MSKLIYMIQVWGGCEKYLLNSLQIVQNRAARIITRLERDTPISIILKQCGWLSMPQLVFYHLVVLVHRVQITGVPNYLYNTYIDGEEKSVRTRQDSLRAS